MSDVEEILKMARNLVGEDNRMAEACFARALSLEPTHTKTLATYAIFLETIKCDFDHAERLVKCALCFLVFIPFAVPRSSI
jgi:hypothetical protein